MIVAGLVALGLAALFGIGWAGIGGISAVRHLLGRRHKAAAYISSAGLRIYRKISIAYYRFFVWTLLIVCLVMTLNCFILYHASTFSEQYFGEDDNVYALEELIGVYNMVAEQCNRLSGEMLRDEDGMALYPGSLGRDGELLDMEDRCEICHSCTCPLCRELEGARILLLLRTGRCQEAEERLLRNLQVQPWDEYMLAIRHVAFGG